jgi:hypothetical protein
MVGGWRGLLGFIGEAVDFNRALRLVAVNAECAGGGFNALLVWLYTAGGLMLSPLFISRQPYPLGLGPVDAEFAGSGVYAALWSAAPPWNIGASCAFIPICRQPNPFRNMLGPLKRGEFGAMEVFKGPRNMRTPKSWGCLSGVEGPLDHVDELPAVGLAFGLSYRAECQASRNAPAGGYEGIL